MSKKTIICFTIAINLVIGNFFLLQLQGKNEPINSLIALHATTSLVSVVILTTMFRINATKMWKVVVIPIIFSAFVPMISTFLMANYIVVTDGELLDIFKSIMFSIIAGFVSAPLWIILGLFNCLCYSTQYKKTKESIFS